MQKTKGYLFFHFKDSWTLIVGLWSLGFAAMIGITWELEKLLFVFSLVFFSAAFLWSLGYWYTCDTLHKMNPNEWPRQRKRNVTNADRLLYKSVKYGVALSLGALLFFAFEVTEHIALQKELSKLHGWLYPSGEPLPPNACNDVLQSGKGLLVYFGGQFAGGGDKVSFPHTVLEIKQKRVISIDKGSDGSLGLSLDVFDQNENIIARIERGRFVVNQNNSLEMIRTDRSSLRVIDIKGREVLNVRYFNPRAIWVDAVLYYPGFPGTIRLHGSELKATSCAFNGGKADIAYE